MMVMLESFAALFAAHVAADYLAQTTWIVRNKHRAGVLALHIALVFVFAAIAVGFTGWAALLLLTASHGIMDIIKTHVLPERKLWPYLLDQAVHVGTLVIVAALAPGLVTQGLWGQLWPDEVGLMTVLFLVLGFAIFAVRAGGFAVELWLKHVPPRLAGTEADTRGWIRSSQWIGQIERGIVFTLVMIGQPLIIAPLAVAKYGMRLNAVRGDRAAQNYVIFGTLASFGWAICTAAVLLAVLPNGALETLGLTP